MSNKRKHQPSILSFFDKNVDVPSDDHSASQSADVEGPVSHQESGAGVGGPHLHLPVLAAEVDEVQAETVGGEVVQAGDKHGKWANSREIMSLPEICQNVHNWYDPNYSEDTSGSRSTVLARKQNLPAQFQTDFPDALIIKVSDILKFSPNHFDAGELFEDHIDVDGEGNKFVREGCDRVLGVLCEFCRKCLSRSGPNPAISQLWSRNRGILLNVPRAPPFGGIREIFKGHEFGSKIKGELWKKGPCAVRKLILGKDMDVADLGSSSTFHMRSKLEEVTSKKVDNSNTRPDQLVLKKLVCNQPTSYDAIQMLIAMSLKLIKQRVSLRDFLKSEIEFLRTFGSPEPIKYLHDTLNMHYTSARAVEDIIDSLDLAKHYGVLMDVMANRPPGADPNFGVMLDCGSAVAHFREYCGFDIKVEGKEGFMVCRVLGFPATDKKTGFKLIQVFQELVEDFNKKSSMLEKIFKMAGVSTDLPPADVEMEDGSYRRPILTLKGVDGLGVDGALLSKNLQINQRIQYHNPHCTSIWCACHSGQLSVTRLHAEASKESHPLSDRQVAMMNVDGQSVHTWIDQGVVYTKKIHDIMTASCQVDKIFKDTQISTQEAKQFRDNKAVQVGGRSMHRWESDFNACRRISKIIQSIIETMESMMRKGLCNDPNRPIMYSVRNVQKVIKDAEFWANVKWREDILGALVKYIINMEYSEADPEALAYNKEQCLRELEDLVSDPSNPGSRAFKQYMERFKSGGDLESWKHSGEDFNEPRIKKLYYQATNNFIAKFNATFPKETSDLLEMFSWLSLTQIRRKVKTSSELKDFKKDAVEETVKFFCKEKTFMPPFSLTDPLKTRGAPTVTAEPMVGSEDDLLMGIDQLKRHLFMVKLLKSF